MNKNSLVAVAADRGAANWIRSWFYPAGAKEVKITLQATNGWVTLDPDPNRGFIVTFVPRPTNQGGRWLRGPMANSACNNDVKIARALLGHRPWMVSTWRVHVYRVISIGLTMAVAMNLGVDSVTLALVASAIIVSIPSPCTPRGLMLWCEKMGWDENKLATNAMSDDNLETLRKRIQSANEEAAD